MIPSRWLLASLFLVLIPSLRAEPAKKTAQWALYVYMGSDYSDVQIPSLDDLEEMESVGSTGDVHVVVQRDGARGAGMRRYLVQKSHKSEGKRRRPFSEPIEVHPAIDSGSTESLEDFLTWSLAKFPAKRRMLILAGHSWGWMGAMQDEQEKSIMRFPRLASVIRECLDAAGQGPFDLLLFDACNTGSVEVSYQLKDLTRYLVFSAMEMPFKGLPWDRILKRLVEHPEQGAPELASWMVKSFVASYAPGGEQQNGAYDAVALMCLDLSRMGPVFEAIRDLGRALKDAGRTPASYPHFKRMAGLDGYLDVVEMGRGLAHSKTPAIRDRALDLLRIMGASPGGSATGAARIQERREKPFTLDVTIEIARSRAPRSGPVEITKPTYTGRRGRAGVLRELIRINPELSPKSFESPRVEVKGSKAMFQFRLASGPVAGGHEVAFRPYLASSTRATLRDSTGKTRVLDYPSTHFEDDFPATSPVRAAGCSNGAFPCQGLGVYYVDEIEPNHIVRGPGLYRQLAWDRYARWSAFLFH